MTMNVCTVWVDNEYVHILTDGGQELRERIADYVGRLSSLFLIHLPLPAAICGSFCSRLAQ
ncbi:MAG: hypothetical protein AUK63_1638 [bacterium P3]|nr:MAG: hypothetical protein AUK63_1638 [bacterium P3]KWW39016.1 MAG: hypothetical protein F083_1976 [bacterium F083]